MATAKISGDFKAQTYKAIFSVILFIFVYLLLLLVAIAIFAASAYGAFLLVTVKFSFITLGLGVGLLAVGVFVMVFMLKFIFQKNNADYSHLTAIDIEKEPELHNLITELVEQTQTQFPKKIYLSSEVNASVFYDSTFWSMFLPVKKNLHIGLGLVNTTTVSELKGILAHEFGHFSQRSMKVGSYVYNVNKIIHNILYDNEDYERNVQQWSNRSGYFILLIGIAIAFNKGVQHILRQLYKIVNVNHMALSRQMEFHADAIASHIVGSEPMINSLLRMNLASESYGSVISFYNSKFEEAYRSENIFPQQSAALNFIAQNNKIAIINNFPNVTPDFSERFNKSKLVIKNQWDSHPSEEERIAAYKKMNIPLQNPDNRPANVLFTNLEKLQCEVTQKLFSGIVYPKEPVYANLEVFSKYIEEDYRTNKFPEVFNSYYSSHNIGAFDIDETVAHLSQKPALETLFDNEKTELIFVLSAQQNDAETLKQISENPYELKTFDYDGIKYKTSEALAVSQQIGKLIAENLEWVRANDHAIFCYFYLTAKDLGEHHKLADLYREHFKADAEYDEKIALHQKMNDSFAFAYETLQSNTINLRMADFKKTEAKFKETLQHMLADPFYHEAITADIGTVIEKYIADPLAYFFNDKYNDEEIAIKNEALNCYGYVLNQMYFIKKKKLLDFEASLLS